MTRVSPLALRAFVVVLAVLIVAGDVMAQFSTRRSRPSSRERWEAQGRELLEENRRLLEDARFRRNYQEALSERETPGRKAIESLEERAASVDRSAPAPAPENANVEAQRQREADRAALLEEALERISPEARAAIEGQPVQVAQATTTSPPRPSGPGTTLNPANVPLPPLPKRKPFKRGELLATITAQGGAHFHASNRIVVFTDNVVVDHQNFKIYCDELAVYLKQSSDLGGLAGGGSEGVEAASDPATTPEATGEQKSEDDAIEKAIATGGTVTVIKKGADGKTQIGKARTVIYIAETGDIEMRDWPTLQIDRDLVKAKSPETVLYLKQDGNHDADGPVGLEVLDRSQSTEVTTQDATGATP